MDDNAKTEIYSLEQSVLRLVEQCRTVSSKVDVEPELLEELGQIAIALHYTVQTLKHKLGLRNAPEAIAAPAESSSDLRMTVELPLNTKINHTVTRP